MCEKRAKANYLAIGKAEGEAKGKADSLLVLLRLKFNRVPGEAESKVRSASTEQLDAWTAAVLTAANLDELLAAKP